MAAGQWVMICTPVEVFTSAVTDDRTPLVVNMTCRSLTTESSPSSVGQCQVSQRWPGAAPGVSPSALMASRSAGSGTLVV